MIHRRKELPSSFFRFRFEKQTSHFVLFILWCKPRFRNGTLKRETETRSGNMEPNRIPVGPPADTEIYFDPWLRAIMYEIPYRIYLLAFISKILYE